MFSSQPWIVVVSWASIDLPDLNSLVRLQKEIEPFGIYCIYRLVFMEIEFLVDIQANFVSFCFCFVLIVLCTLCASLHR